MIFGKTVNLNCNRLTASTQYVQFILLKMQKKDPPNLSDNCQTSLSYWTSTFMVDSLSLIYSKLWWLQQWPPVISIKTLYDKIWNICIRFVISWVFRIWKILATASWKVDHGNQCCLKWHFWQLSSRSKHCMVKSKVDVEKNYKNKSFSIKKSRFQWMDLRRSCTVCSSTTN